MQAKYAPKVTSVVSNEIDHEQIPMVDKAVVGWGKDSSNRRFTFKGLLNFTFKMIKAVIFIISYMMMQVHFL